MAEELSNEYQESIAEIYGRIYLQAKLLMPDGNYPEISKITKILLNDVEHKLRGMLYHKYNYGNIENGIIAEALKVCKKESDKINVPDALLFEFEAFLFQTKSSLDLAIKILEVFFPGKFEVHTFENQGGRLMKNLERYKTTIINKEGNQVKDIKRLEKVKNIRYETIDNIINMLKNDKTVWLDKAINIRDTVSHYRGSGILSLHQYTFEVKDKDKCIIKSPMILNVYPREFIDITYQNCIEFIQDFLCLSIELWLPPSFAVTIANDLHPTLKGWHKTNFTPAKYIKYTLGTRTNLK